MSIVWEQRIRHFDRRIKRRHLRFLKASQRRSTWRTVKGLPSRNLPAALSIESLRLKMSFRQDIPTREETEKRRKRLMYELLRSRLLERKRNERAKIRSRKVTVGRTGINLWKRRRDWLVEVEATRAADDDA